MKVGFLVPPTVWNDAPLDFLRVAPDGTSVAGAFIPVRGMGRTMAGFTLDRIAEALPAMQEGARDLAVAGADVVAQFGIPFSLVHAERAREEQSQVAEAAGVPVVLMGAAMLDALDELGVRRIAIAGGYYTTGDWTSMARRGFEANGFDVVFQEGWVEQGIVASEEGSDRLAWEPDAAVTKAHVLRTAERAGGGVDAIVACGGGLRLLGHAAELETATGLPVVAGDLAMFRATLRAMGTRPRSTGWGRLLDGGLGVPASPILPRHAQGGFETRPYILIPESAGIGGWTHRLPGRVVGFSGSSCQRAGLSTMYCRTRDNASSSRMTCS